MNLTTTYLGMKLRTPLVPSASSLSEDLDKIKQMEQAGASAVVLHSLFEEQTEADVAAKAEFRVTPAAYLKHIAEAKRGLKIPIIASLNARLSEVGLATRVRSLRSEPMRWNLTSTGYRPSSKLPVVQSK